MLVNHLATPSAQRLHETHVVFAFGGKSCYRLALDDGLAGLEIDNASEQSRTVTDSADYSAIGIDL